MDNDSPIRLKGNYYARPDYFNTDVAKGVTRTPTGARMCAVADDFLIGFRTAIMYECGPAYRLVLKTAGKRWGDKFIARMDQELTAYYGRPFRELHQGLIDQCLTEAFNYHGYGLLKIHHAEGFIEIEVEQAVMPSLVQFTERPVDDMMTGLFGAVFSYLLGRTLEAIQTECPSTAGEKTRFLVAAADIIAPIEEWAEQQTPYPNHDDFYRRVTKALVVEDSRTFAEVDA